MPNKTIYVTAADLPLFEKAAHAAGGLSPAIAAALRRYVSDEQGSSVGNVSTPASDLVELEVLNGSTLTRTRFHGQRVAKLRQSFGVRQVTFEIYRTAKGQYVLYVIDRPNWQRWSGDSQMWEEPATWTSDFFRTRDRSMDVFATVEELLDVMPDDLRDDVISALSEPAVRDLDI